MLRSLVLPLGALALVALFPMSGATFYVELTTKIMIMAIFALSLDLLVGWTGLVSFGHAAYFGVGAYTLALLTPKAAAAGLWTSLALAIGIAALCALVVGVFVLRTRGIYFIMVTLAFGEMLFYLFHDNKFAGGSDGTFINIKPEAKLFGVNVIDLDKARVFYWVVLALVVLTILILYLLTRSPFGRALTASRDNERRARSLGFSVYRVRLTAFVISGALAGVAGYFAAAQFGFVAPQMLGWHQSAIALVMVVLGGQRGVAGPLIGAVVVMGLEEYLKGLTEHWKLAEGLIIIAVVLAIPGGVQSLIARIAPERHDD
jgi:branched-chain amino acid transport system permease protein